MKTKKKKHIPHICGTCKLFCEKEKTCAVTILHGGKRVHLPVDPEDYCFFEQPVRNPTTGKLEDLNEIQQAQFWVENEKGEKIDGDGTVKIKYPEGFFGEEDD